jgi:hypothetical protein
MCHVIGEHGQFPYTLVAETKVARAIPIYTLKEVIDDPDWYEFVMNEKRTFLVALLARLIICGHEIKKVVHRLMV